MYRSTQDNHIMIMMCSRFCYCRVCCCCHFIVSYGFKNDCEIKCDRARSPWNAINDVRRLLCIQCSLARPCELFMGKVTKSILSHWSTSEDTVACHLSCYFSWIYKQIHDNFDCNHLACWQYVRTMYNVRCTSANGFVSGLNTMLNVVHLLA